MSQEAIDILIIGAGISGIGTACHLQKRCPQYQLALFEGREKVGGTWDLFRYPGIRSDSDMYTLGYRFKAWTGDNAIAEGHEIRQYLKETAEEYGIFSKIRFNHRVLAANWSSQSARWHVTYSHGAETHVIAAKFLMVCAGYYRYERGYTPDIPGLADFEGQVIHPQHWPEDLDYQDRDITVIGSGATAITLVPELAKKAKSVTMLQRSPTYMIAAPRRDPLRKYLPKMLSDSMIYHLMRAKNISIGMGFYLICQTLPGLSSAWLRSLIAKELGAEFDVDAHFNPDYKPWDQRLCLVTDGDLFAGIRDGKIKVITDQIQRIESWGLELKSGTTQKADIIVTATGLDLQFLGGITLSKDGVAIDPTQEYTYKGIMLSDVPNLAWCFGYVNASWTLRVDLINDYICDLLNHMSAKGYDYCYPAKNKGIQASELLPLDAGYIRRAQDRLPKNGRRTPWRMHQNYVMDRLALRHRPRWDRELKYGRRISS